jgi:hypothetical protein
MGLTACSGGGDSGGGSSLTPASNSGSDTAAPSVPTGFHAAATTSSSVTLAWDASTDNVGVKDYEVYRNGMLIGTSTTNSFSDTGLSSNTSYNYTVCACDTAENKSSQTSAITAVTLVATPTSDPLYAKTQLLRGQWHFVFTIISTFTEDFSLSTIDVSKKNDQGGYYIYGTDKYSAIVLASYWPTDGNWALLDSRNTIDMFYTFYTNGSTILNGSCYYQITVSTGAWSQCFPLSGYKTSSIPAPSLEKQNSTNIEMADLLKLENTTFVPIDDNTRAKYLHLRDMNSSSLK